ncbi:altronate dehydratase family protein [Boseongicola sp. H5]|uniref:UxaA family hydrolase n=1 Tax=Boseongicola sp. H5 TaxID=2763261 RepID=UPI001D0BE20E|nr:altronate dehydratase family protein [Boseongicola sp. H5]
MTVTPVLTETPTALVLCHSPDDTVAICLEPVREGQMVAGVHALSDIPAGHKIALRDHAAGAPVMRYGQPIGIAREAIEAGAHVHSHNLDIGDLTRTHQFGAGRIGPQPTPEPRRFEGIRRADGRVATRNYIGILTTVNCSAHVAELAAQAFARNPLTGHDPLAEFPNVDGVVAFGHKTGCGMAEGEALETLQRTITGYARHPNFSHVIVLGLGCEVNQTNRLPGATTMDGRMYTMNIQREGGTLKTVQAIGDLVRQLLPEANAVTRDPAPLSHLSLALICGGSDGYSGITANPALGVASDMLTAHGATVILSETPETYGAEHLLSRRAISDTVGQALVDRIDWWTDCAARHGISLDANPSPGNKAGGLTTILEKSLGALAKAGRSDLRQVVRYAEPATESGLVFMDGPGFDPVQVTGQIASGANLVAFTTGRGSVFGSKPAPTLKIATNSKIFTHMQDDMDIDAGPIARGDATAETKGAEIFEALIALASGRKSKSEAFGFGGAEFAPWVIGPTI